MLELSDESLTETRGKERSPSPGKDYNSLLYDSSFDETGSQLRSENGYLKAQAQLLEKEKQMHIEMHAQHRHAAARDMKEMQQRLSTERAKFKNDIETITQELIEVQSCFQIVKKKKKQQAEEFTVNMKNCEDSYLKSLAQKDNYIKELETKLKINDEHKQPRMRRKQKSQTQKEKPRDGHIHSISKLIVTLEKEQAHLKEALNDLENTADSARESKKIAELIHRNQARLLEAHNIQEDLIQSLISKSNI